MSLDSKYSEALLPAFLAEKAKIIQEIKGEIDVYERKRFAIIEQKLDVANEELSKLTTTREALILTISNKIQKSNDKSLADLLKKIEEQNTALLLSIEEQKKQQNKDLGKTIALVSGLVSIMIYLLFVQQILQYPVNLLIEHFGEVFGAILSFVALGLPVALVYWYRKK